MNLFASIYEQETHAVRLYIDNSLGPLARDSLCVKEHYLYAHVMNSSQ